MARRAGAAEPGRSGPGQRVAGAGPRAGTSPTRRSTWCPTPDATSPGSRFRSTRVRQQALGSAHMAPPLELTSVPVGGDSTAPARRSDRRALDGAGHRRARRRDRRGLGRQIAAHRPDANPRVHLVDDIEAARRALHDDLADAVVGWRLLLAGPAHACLRVRADALEAGRPTTDHGGQHRGGHPRIYCAHCRTVTLARIGSPARCPASAAAAVVRLLPRVPPARDPSRVRQRGQLPGHLVSALLLDVVGRRRRGARDPHAEAGAPGPCAAAVVHSGQPPRRRVRRRGQRLLAHRRTSAPQEYTVSVLNRVDGRGGSRWIHGLSVGDTVAAREPRSVRPVLRARRHLLIAAGIGITRWCRTCAAPAVGPRCPAALHPPGRPWRLRRRIRALTDQARFFTDRAAFLAELAAALPDSPFGTHAYVCGPGVFIDDVVALATGLGWPASRIHVEHFGGELAPGEPFEVELTHSGQSFVVGSGVSLLEALEAHGHAVPNMCRQGCAASAGCRCARVSCCTATYT